MSLSLSLNHIVAPSTQGANSASPNPSASLLVGAPLAVASTCQKYAPCTPKRSHPPSSTVPQLMSISSSIWANIAVLVASLSEGAGLQPNTLPRPVVKYIRFTPLAKDEANQR